MAETVHLSRLQPGKRNQDVVRLKRKLNEFGFTRSTEGVYFGKKLRADYRAWQAHLGYTGEEANGLPDQFTLEKLDFEVLP